VAVVAAVVVGLVVVAVVAAAVGGIVSLPEREGVLGRIDDHFSGGSAK